MLFKIAMLPLDSEEDEEELALLFKAGKWTLEDLPLSLDLQECHYSHSNKNDGSHGAIVWWMAKSRGKRQSL